MDAARELEDRGRCWLRGFLSAGDVADLARHCDGGRPGARLELSAELARHVGQGSILSRRVAGFSVHPSPVRLVAFNKTASANWGVPWHQDRVIAVGEKHDAPGYSSWVSKGAFWHVEPPISVLQSMLFVRVHLDRASERNGALELALGSHKHGLVPADVARDAAVTCDIEICSAEPGDVLVVKALTLHRSRTAQPADNRRALRIDYAKRSGLAAALRWASPA